ncbi:hypothetical protein LEP1GSC193_1269 [Leptospira alstonii serovar Pingchang str. 80-412]|uniref:Uncharacterized protein n=2 Tax=Leptospira alstonii TaxID=28452 RepID=M6CPG7_9LEPT|nr:hypothetical protein LEP1GSC194_0038 [Leptospira alstonii serovar Sichuan str. 79601]EQA78572.1 hypothetical protein LEP1GSC193_1269 [Leptospira alstonii serovar Pingchang str. 80-412]
MDWLAIALEHNVPIPSEFNSILLSFLNEFQIIFGLKVE